MSPAIRNAALIAAAFALNGCAAVVPGPPPGIIYQDITAPHTSTLTEVTGGPKSGDKVGQACITGILGLVSTGDASVDTAKKDGGITNISSVETYTMSVLGLYVKYCTEVYGT